MADFKVSYGEMKEALENDYAMAITHGIGPKSEEWQEFCMEKVSTMKIASISNLDETINQIKETFKEEVIKPLTAWIPEETFEGETGQTHLQIIASFKTDVIHIGEEDWKFNKTQSQYNLAEFKFLDGCSKEIFEKFLVNLLDEDGSKKLFKVSCCYYGPRNAPEWYLKENGKFWWDCFHCLVCPMVFAGAEGNVLCGVCREKGIPEDVVSCLKEKNKEMDETIKGQMAITESLLDDYAKEKEKVALMKENQKITTAQICKVMECAHICGEVSEGEINRIFRPEMFEDS